MTRSAKLFANGRSKAARLLAAYQFEARKSSSAAIPKPGT